MKAKINTNTNKRVGKYRFYIKRDGNKCIMYAISFTYILFIKINQAVIKITDINLFCVFICFFLNNDLNIPSIQVHFLPQRNDKEKIP